MLKLGTEGEGEGESDGTMASHELDGICGSVKQPALTSDIFYPYSAYVECDGDHRSTFKVACAISVRRCT